MSDGRKKRKSCSDESDISQEQRRKEKEKDRKDHKKSKRSHEKKSKHKKHRREHSRSRERDSEKKKRYDDDYRRDRRERDDRDNKYRKRYESDDEKRDSKSTRRRSRSTHDRKRNYTPEKKSGDSKNRFSNKESEKSSNQSSPEKASNLISSSAPKLSLVPNIPMTTVTTLQPLAIAPALPAYYNPGVVNATKFADQQKKRKLLWSGSSAKETPKETTWTNTAFSQDNDGSKANKFFRLMGIKETTSKAEPVALPKTTTAPTTSTTKSSEQMFSNMEQQYEIARQHTHLSRGLGLGFK